MKKHLLPTFSFVSVDDPFIAWIFFAKNILNHLFIFPKVKLSLADIVSHKLHKKSPYFVFFLAFHLIFSIFQSKTAYCKPWNELFFFRFCAVVSAHHVFSRRRHVNFGTVKRCILAANHEIRWNDKNINSNLNENWIIQIK